jgi:hypothetical protein
MRCQLYFPVPTRLSECPLSIALGFVNFTEELKSLLGANPLFSDRPKSAALPKCLIFFAAGAPALADALRRSATGTRLARKAMQRRPRSLYASLRYPP